MELTIDCVECKKPQLLKVKSCDLERYKAGEGHVQAIFNYLSPAEKEMLMSQVCSDCYDEIFHQDEDEL